MKKTISAFVLAALLASARLAFAAPCHWQWQHWQTGEPHSPVYYSEPGSEPCSEVFGGQNCTQESTVAILD